MEKVMLTHLLT